MLEIVALTDGNSGRIHFIWPKLEWFLRSWVLATQFICSKADVGKWEVAYSRFETLRQLICPESLPPLTVNRRQLQDNVKISKLGKLCFKSDSYDVKLGETDPDPSGWMLATAPRRPRPPPPPTSRTSPPSSRRRSGTSPAHCRYRSHQKFWIHYTLITA